MLIGRNSDRGLKRLTGPLLGILMAAATPHVYAAPSVQPTESVHAFTDLDGDLHPDAIRYSLRGLDGTGYLYTVQFEMSAKRRSPSIGVHSGDAWGLQIMARDVDGDHDLDLVVTTAAHGGAVDVWLNDGQGGFTSGGFHSFPLSIWQPEAALTSPSCVPVRDPLLIPAGDGSTALIPAAAAYPINSTSALRTPLIAARADFRQFNAASPRAPPSV